MTTAMSAVDPLGVVSKSVASRPKAASLFASVATEIEAADQIFTTTLAAYRSPIAPLVQHLKHYRGKRLRPALLLLVARACGSISPAHPTLAAAVEMIHTATLVHDDVLDEAELRRHVPTVNAGWGNTISILLGDMLFTHAFHLTSTIDARACRLIGEATNRVCAGELRQACERGNLNLTESDYFAMIEGKTAALTECAARLGALYAGASEDIATSLGCFGRALGIAFQIADDLLYLLGNEAITGKTLGTDLEQKKLTLPLIHCLAQLPASEAESLRDQIRRGDPGVGSRVLAAMESTQSLLYAREKADDFASRAREFLQCLPRSESRGLLEHLTQWSIRREK